MTREEAISKHRKMWRWLAENPGKLKEDYLEEFDPEAAARSMPNISCPYICEYVFDDTSPEDCFECPLEWPDGFCVDPGPCNEWEAAIARKDYVTAAKLARQIAELPEPWKEEEKTEKNTDTERPDAKSLTNAYRRLELMAINLVGEAAKGNNAALKDYKAINVAQWAVKECLREKGKNTWI